MAGGYPCNASLGVCEDVGKPLRRDTEYPGWLVRGIREVVQPIATFGEIDDISWRKCLFTLRRADLRHSSEDEEHLLDAVVHVQRPSRRFRQKLNQRSAEHVGLERMA